MTFPTHWFKTPLAIAVASTLIACGGTTEQDVGQPTQQATQVTFTGLAIDGYLANALVWLDLKDNNSLDAFEPYAYTDSQGYFSYNPTTGTDYCASTDVSHARFCLRSGAVQNTAQIRISGGTDLVTGELFKGMMTKQITRQQAEENHQALVALGPKPDGDDVSWQQQIDQIQTKVTPLSSLEHYLPAGTDLVSILLNLGIEIPGSVDQDMLLNSDYIAGLGSTDDVSEQLFQAAVTLQRVVDTFALHLDKAAGDLDLGTSGLPASSAAAVWSALAETIESSPREQGLTDFTLVAQRAVEQFVAQLREADSDVSVSVIQRIEQKASDPTLLAHVSLIVENASAVFQSGEKHDLYAGAQSIELVLTAVDKVLEGDLNEEQVVELVDVLSDDQSKIVEALSQQLNRIEEGTGGQVDLHTLSNQLLNDLADNGRANISVENLINESTLATVQSDTPLWQNKSLSLSGIHEGAEQGQAIMYFDGKADASSGELVMCIAYNNDNDPSENILGQRFEGSWTLLDPKQPNRMSILAEGFSIQMKIAGATYGKDIPENEQVASLRRDSATEFGKFRFVYNGESSNWYSDHASDAQNYGLQSFDTGPQSDDECKALLQLN